MALIGIGIEILLGLKQKNYKLEQNDSVEAFADWLACEYNSLTTGTYSMRSKVVQDYVGEEPEWTLVDDITIDVNRATNQCKSSVYDLRRQIIY